MTSLLGRCNAWLVAKIYGQTLAEESRTRHPEFPSKQAGEIRPNDPAILCGRGTVISRNPSQSGMKKGARRK